MEHIEYFQSLNIIYFPNICPFIQYTNLRINCFRNFHNNCSICSVLNRVLLTKIASFLCTKKILRDVCQVQPTVISNCGKPAQTSSKHGFLFVCVLIMARLLNIFFHNSIYIFNSILSDVRLAQRSSPAPHHCDPGSIMGSPTSAEPQPHWLISI